MQFDELCVLVIIAFMFLIDLFSKTGLNDVLGCVFIVAIFIYFIKYRLFLQSFPKNAVPYKLNRHHYNDMWLYGLLLSAASIPLIAMVAVFSLITLPFIGIRPLSDFYFLLPDFSLALIVISVPLWLFCRNLSVLLKMRKMEKAITP